MNSQKSTMMYGEDLPATFACFVKETHKQLDVSQMKELKKTATFTLSGDFPVYPNVRGACMITFHQYSQLTIYLSHDQVLQDLRAALLNLKLELRKQPFDYHAVQLACVTIRFNAQESHEFSQCITDFLYKYIRANKRITQSLCTKFFQQSDSSKAAVKLLNIDRRIWTACLQHTKQFDYRNGTSNQYRYDYDKQGIKVPYVQATKPGYYAYVVPENPEQTDQYLTLLWQPLHIINNGLMFTSMKDDNETWNAMTTFKWLINEFILEVSYYRKKRHARKLTFSEFKARFNISRYVEVDEQLLHKYFFNADEL